MCWRSGLAAALTRRSSPRSRLNWSLRGSACVICLTGVVSRLEAAGKRWNAARKKERELAAELYEAIREAVAGGMSEAEAARVAGVDRMTVRRALGKR